MLTCYWAWISTNCYSRFGDLISREQQLEGTFRFMHERLCTHAESVAFFGGGAREKAMVESRFRELLTHTKYILKRKWLFGILDDFITNNFHVMSLGVCACCMSVNYLYFYFVDFLTFWT